MKINVFCNDLAGALGSKFTSELMSDEQEQAFKRMYGRLVSSFSDSDISQGFQKLAALIANKSLIVYNLHDVLFVFDKYQASPEKTAKLYNEYLNGGIDVEANAKHPAGHMVKIKVGKQWSKGFMLEISKNLGSAKYHEEVYGKKAKDVFSKELSKIGLRMRRGEVFEIPEALEDKSQEVRSREHYKEAGKSGHAEFMKRFKQ